MAVHHDQHFLCNLDIVKESIRAAKLTKKDIVLEIGPGKGILTREIAKHCAQVIAIEIDKTLSSELADLPSNVELIFGNALQLIPKFKFAKIIANIPYVISEPLLKKLLTLKVECAVLLVGESFYKILLDEDSKWSFTSKLFFNIEKITDVSRESFDPKPRVNSVLIRITPLKNKPSTSESILKEVILQDDKLLKNALMFALLRVKKYTKNQSRESIAALDLDEEWLSKRVEHLSNLQFNVVKDKILTLHF